MAHEAVKVAETTASAALTTSAVSSKEDYRAKVNELASLEKLLSSSPSTHSKSLVRSLYNGLLQRWPCLEGFWVRWAHTEFRMESVASAIEVFQRSLHVPILKNSLVVWTEYLRFKLRICQISLPELREEFRTAAELVGSHFLSHEFWDLYLEISDDPVMLLVDILTERTVHQFARFYAQLLEFLDSEHLYTFQRVLSLESELSIESETAVISSDEETRMRKVITSKLQLRYELHRRRVNEVLPFEQKITRPFFYPTESKDVSTWLSYARASELPEFVYRRALIPCYTHSQLQLGYIRFKIRTKASDCEIREAYELGISTGSVPLILHYALWLEYQGDLDAADLLYLKAAEAHPIDGKVNVYRSQFMKRIGKVPTNANPDLFQATTSTSESGTKSSLETMPSVCSTKKTQLDDELYNDNDL